MSEGASPLLNCNIQNKFSAAAHFYCKRASNGSLTQETARHEQNYGVNLGCRKPRAWTADTFLLEGKV